MKMSELVSKTIEDAEVALAIKNKDGATEINVKSFGATGDGTTDDSTSIDQAIAFCLNMQQEGKKPVLFFPPSSGFATSKTITVPPNIGIDMHSSLIYTGQLNEPCLVIGETILGTTTVYRLNVDRQNQADWTNENNIGIKFYNATTSDIFIERVRGFTIGVQCIGSDEEGFVYNTIRLGTIGNGKIGIDLTAEINGWTNENLFLGGRIHVDSNIHPTKNRYGIRISSIDLTYPGNNNNVFQKPSIEIGESGVDAVPVLIEHGMQNYFYDARTEGDYTCAMRTLNDSTRNYMTVGYGESNIEQEGVAGDNFIELNYQPSSRNSSIYQFNDLHKIANHYSDTEIYIPGFDFDWGGPQYQITNVGILPNYLELNGSREIRKQADTTSCKRFVVGPVALPGYGGRVAIKCYDVNDVLLLDDAEGSIHYCKGTTNRVMYWSTSSQSYETGSDSNSPIYFMVSDEVKRIEIQLKGGTNTLRLQGFSIISLDGPTRVYSLFAEKNVGQGLAIKAPILGTYDKGKVIFNNNPIEQSDGSIVEGWICMTSGSPGVWAERKNYPRSSNLDYEILKKDLTSGDSSQDNYAKLVALVTAAQTNDKGLYIPNGSYYCSENLVIQGIRNIVIDGEIVMAPGKMLDVVYNAASTNGCNWNINTVTGKIRISGVKNGIVKINDATVLELYANGDDPLKESLAYSQFHLGNINTFNILSEGVSEGWINENTFYGGRIDFINIDGNYPHNHNTFYKLMIEGATVNIVKGNSNRFYDCRFEGHNVVNFGVEAFDNVFTATWVSGKGYYLRNAGAINIGEVNDLGVSNRVIYADDSSTEKKVVYAVNYDSNNFPVELILKNQFNLQTKDTWETFFETGLIKLTGDMAIHLVSDVAICRPRVYFYDEFKQLITTATSLIEHVSHIGMTWDLAYDTNLFSLNYDGSEVSTFGMAIFKTIPAKYIKIGLAFGGSLKTFENLELSVRTMNRKTLNVPLSSRFQRYSSPTIPTDGYWKIGNVVYNSVPSSGKPIGWICTAEGSPGTWKSFDGSQVDSLSADPVAPIVGQMWLRSDL